MLTKEEMERLENFVKMLSSQEDVVVFQAKICLGDCHITINTDRNCIGGSTPELEVVRIEHYTLSRLPGCLEEED